MRLTTSSRWRSMSSSDCDSGEFPDMLVRPSRPKLDHRVLPPEDQSSAKDVFDNLNKMDQQIADFDACVELFLWAHVNAEQKEQYLMSLVRQWGSIGARTGALHIYGFYQNFQSFNGALALNRSMGNIVDRTALRDARRSFIDDFPDFADVRLGAAHPGEIFATEVKVQKHAAAGRDDSIIDMGGQPFTLLVEGSVLNGAYTFTIDKKVVSYRPEADSVVKLARIADRLWAAMEPACEFIKGLSLQASSGSSQRP